MEMTTGLTVALILVALAVLMQAGAMLGIYLTVRKVPAQIEGVRADVNRRIEPLSRSITEIVNNSREPLQTISALEMVATFAPTGDWNTVDESGGVHFQQAFDVAQSKGHDPAARERQHVSR